MFKKLNKVHIPYHMARDLSEENAGLWDPASTSYTWHPSYLPQEADYSDLGAMKNKFPNSETGL